MENKELYEKTVSILVKAYQNDELNHDVCDACAVGNLVRAGSNIGRTQMHKLRGWPTVFCTTDINRQKINPLNYKGEAKAQIDATGYSWQELAKIEYAFESVPYIENDDECMFNGLMAVIDVLDQIHNNTDPVLTKSTKERFKKQPVENL